MNIKAAVACIYNTLGNLPVRSCLPHCWLIGAELRPSRQLAGGVPWPGSLDPRGAGAEPALSNVRPYITLMAPWEREHWGPLTLQPTWGLASLNFITPLLSSETLCLANPVLVWLKGGLGSWDTSWGGYLCPLDRDHPEMAHSCPHKLTLLM